MSPCYTLLGVSVVLTFSVISFTAAQGEACRGWSAQPKSARCKNAAYARICPEDAALNCGGKPSSESGSSGPSSDGPASSSSSSGGSSPQSSPGADDPDICPGWKKQGKKIYCKKANFAEYCPESAASCGQGGGGGGGGGGKKTTKRPKTTRRTTKKPATTKATPAPKSFDADENLIECCEANGVKPACIGLCKYKDPDAQAVCDETRGCEDDIKKAYYCGTNGQDETACCEDEGVPSICLQYVCNGNAPQEEYPQVDNLDNMLARQSCFSIGGGPNANCLKPAVQQAGTKSWKKRNWKKQSFHPLIRDFVNKNPPCA